MVCFKNSYDILIYEDNDVTLIIVSGQIEVEKAYNPGDRVIDSEWLIFKLSLYIYMLFYDIIWKLP